MALINTAKNRALIAGKEEFTKQLLLSWPCGN